MQSTEILDSLKQGITFSQGFTFNNICIWIALVELAVITYLLFKIRRRYTLKKTISQVAFNPDNQTDIDFDNIIVSTFNARQLFDLLKVKCHPDLFSTDNEKRSIAENLFQEISKNKNNYKKLLELKEQVIQQLKIKI